MKKILLILVASIAAIYCNAQIIQYLGAPNTTIEIRGKLVVDSASTLPDTLASAPVGSLSVKNNSLFIKTSAGWNFANSPRTTIAKLRSSNLSNPLSYYYIEDVGRQGNFSYDATDNSTADDGAMTVVDAGNHRYKRIMANSYINVTWFGAVGDGSTNSTAAIQATIDFATTHPTLSKCVYIPQGVSGNYLVDSINIRNCSIIGDNGRTTIQARTSSASGLFVLKDTPVQKITIANLTLVGNTFNTNQHGFNITAIPQTAPAYTGGMWDSKFENITISGFKGHGFHFYCSDGLGDMANQFLILDHVKVTCTSDSTSKGLYVEGQMGQLSVFNSEFDGQGSINAGTVGIDLRSLLTSNDQIFGSIVFKKVTIQAFKKAIYTYFTQGVTFENCWFENDSLGVHGTNNSRLIVRENHFANVGTGAGTYIIGNDGSIIDFLANGIYGTINGRMYTSPAGSLTGGRMEGNYGQAGLVFTTVFTSQNINVSSNTLNLGYARDVVTNGTYSKANYVNTINSSLAPGEEVTIRCYENANPNSFLAFNRTAGNIDIPFSLDSGFLVIRPRGSVRFKRSDLLNNWALVGYSNPPLYSDTVPQTGSWFTGEVVYSNHPSVGKAAYWMCKQGGQPGSWDSVVLGASANIVPNNTVNNYFNGYGIAVNLNTDSITEGTTNKFFTNSRARTSISLTTSGSGSATYNNSTGVLNIPTPYADPLTTNGDIVARVSGSTTRLPQGGNNTFLGVQGGALSYYAPFILTTTGSSGAATFSGGTLNIPQYSAGAGGITSLNTLTGASQTLVTGTSGSDFGISSVGTTHTFNLPVGDPTHTGKISSTDWTAFHNKADSIVKRNDSFLNVRNSVLTFLGRDSVQWAMAKDTVVRATTTSARNDANSVVMLPDGSLICAYTGFGTQVGDVDSAAILWKRSYDHGRTWTSPDTAVKLGGSGSYIPSLYVKNNGTVLMLYLYQPNVNIGYINSVTLASPYTPGTWSAPSTLYNPSQYQSPASDRILKTQSGSLLYATCYPTTADHSSAGGNYYVKILKSTDDGATWAAQSYQIASSDSLAVEPGLFQVDDGSIYCYFRNRSGFVGMALSTDTANSFTASFPTNLYSPNSTSTIKYYQKYRRLFALHNKHDQWTSDAINGTSGRFAMQISTSPNNGIDWYRQTYIDSTTGYYSFEPSIFFDTVTNEVLCTYSKFNNAGSLCDLQNVRVPIYHLVGTADVHELNDLILTPSYSRSYPQRAGGIPYGHQGLRFLTMTQKEIGFTQGTTNPAGDYMAFSQANSNVGIFAGLLLNKTHSLNSGMTFETTTKAETGSPTFQFSSIDSGASNVSGTFPGTTKIFGVLNNYLNTGLGFFVYGNGQIDVGGNNTSSFLRVYNNVLGPTNAFFTVGSVTGGNTGFAPWIHMKGNNSSYGMTWDCNTSTNAPNSSFWIDGNNAGAAIANTSSLFRVDNNGAATVNAPTKVRLQLLGDGRLSQNTLAPTAMLTIQGSTTQSQIGSTGWRSSFLPGTYVDNVTGNGNVIRFVASDYHGTDSFATSNTVTYSNLANGYFKGNQKVGGSLTVTHKWGIMIDSGDAYINGNLNLTSPAAGAITDNFLVRNPTDSTVKTLSPSSLVGIRNYAHTIFTPSTGGTVSLVVNQYNIVNPSGTIATLTVNLPSSPSNNDVVYIKYTQAVTAVTYANGTVVDGVTAPGAGGLVVLTYDSGTTSWY